MRNFDFKRYTPGPKKLLRASLKTSLQLALKQNARGCSVPDAATKQEIKMQ